MEVVLLKYDVSNGAANYLSSALVGKHLDGVWHTSVKVFGYEYHFGRNGIEENIPGQSDFGHPPDEKIHMGTTDISKWHLDNYLKELRRNKFAPGKYSLVSHNCNTFSDTLCKFLVGIGIPTEILKLPDDIITGGITRTIQVGTVAGTAYLLHRALKSNESSQNTANKKKKNESPSLLEIGGAVAMAGAAFLSLMSENQASPQASTSRTNSLGWRYDDSDSD